MNARLNTELADFLRRRGVRGEWSTPEDPELARSWPDPWAPLVEDTIRAFNTVRPRPTLAEMGKLLADEANAQSREELNPARSGVKYDQGKAMLSLLGMVTRALADVSRVQEAGAKKYPSPDNWKKVENGSRRYRDAALRHLFADLRGEAFDPETGLPHLAHAACCLLIAREHDLGFTQAEDGFELPPLPERHPEGADEPLPRWRFERPPAR